MLPCLLPDWHQVEHLNGCEVSREKQHFCTFPSIKPCLYYRRCYGVWCCFVGKCALLHEDFDYVIIVTIYLKGVPLLVTLLVLTGGSLTLVV